VSNSAVGWARLFPSEHRAMTSKTTPFTTVSLSPNASLELPIDCQFEGASEVFVWREKSTGNVILSTKPPSMSMHELLQQPSKGPEDERLEVLGQYLSNMYPRPSSQRRRKRAATT
jgi:hypothetical protein